MASHLARALTLYLLILLMYPLSASPLVKHADYKLTVDPLGMTSFELPLVVPSSDKILSPELSVRYSHGYRFSLVGDHMSLLDRSVLSRCRRSPDNEKPAVDGYCLNEEFFQPYDSLTEDLARLIAPGEYLNPRNLNKLRILVNGGRQVMTRGGKRLSFGFGFNEMGHGISPDDNREDARAWHLYRVEDRGRQSRIDYVYHVENSTDDASKTYLRLDRIEYAHIHDSYRYRLRFNYEPRFSPDQHQQGGRIFELRDFLSALTIERGGKYSYENLNEPLAVYRFTYQDHPQQRPRKLLSSIEFCDAKTDECVFPVNLEWSEFSLGESEYPSFDWNARIETGICKNERGDKGNCAHGGSWNTIAPQRVSRGNYVDICYQAENGYTCLQAAKTGDPVTRNSEYRHSVRYRVCDGEDDCTPGTFKPLDINRDGYTDGVYRSVHNELKLLSLVPTYPLGTKVFYHPEGDHAEVRSRNLMYAELNGDRYMDICESEFDSEGRLYCYEVSEMSPTYPQEERRAKLNKRIIDLNEIPGGDSYKTKNPHEKKYVYAISPMDLNGDGLSEFLLMTASGIAILRSDDDGFRFQYRRSSICSDESSCQQDSIRFADINGDATADLCYFDNENLLKCHLGNGRSFLEEVYLSQDLCSPMQILNDCPIQFYRESLAFQDVNLDGLPDLSLVSPKGLEIRLNRGKFFDLSHNVGICRGSASSSCNDRDNHLSFQYLTKNKDQDQMLLHRDDRAGIVLTPMHYPRHLIRLSGVRNGPKKESIRYRSEPIAGVTSSHLVHMVEAISQGYDMPDTYLSEPGAQSKVTLYHFSSPQRSDPFMAPWGFQTMEVAQSDGSRVITSSLWEPEPHNRFSGRLKNFEQRSYNQEGVLASFLKEQYHYEHKNLIRTDRSEVSYDEAGHELVKHVNSEFFDQHGRLIKNSLKVEDLKKGTARSEEKTLAYVNDSSAWNFNLASVQTTFSDGSNRKLETTDYLWDEDGLVSEIIEKKGESHELHKSYQHDKTSWAYYSDASIEVSWPRFMGGGVKDSHYREAYTYGTLGLTTREQKGTGEAKLIGYDGWGRQRSVQEGTQRVERSFNLVGQLQSEKRYLLGRGDQRLSLGGFSFEREYVNAVLIEKTFVDGNLHSIKYFNSLGQKLLSLVKVDSGYFHYEAYIYDRNLQIVETMETVAKKLDDPVCPTRNSVSHCIMADWKEKKADFDKLGRKTSLSDPDLGRRISWEYTVDDTSVYLDGVLHATASFDGQGQLDTLSDNQGNILDLSYDRFGNAAGINISSPSGAEYQAVSLADEDGKRTYFKDPFFGDQSFQYHPLGYLIREVKGDGTVFQYSYDQTGRLLQRTISQGDESERVEQFIYETKSIGGETVFLLKELRSPEVTDLYNYDAFGRIIEKIQRYPENTQTGKDLLGFSGIKHEKASCEIDESIRQTDYKVLTTMASREQMVFNRQFLADPRSESRFDEFYDYVVGAEYLSLDEQIDYANTLQPSSSKKESSTFKPCFSAEAVSNTIQVKSTPCPFSEQENPWKTEKPRLRPSEQAGLSLLIAKKTNRCLEASFDFTREDLSQHQLHIGDCRSDVYQRWQLKSVISDDDGEKLQIKNTATNLCILRQYDQSLSMGSCEGDDALWGYYPESFSLRPLQEPSLCLQYNDILFEGENSLALETCEGIFEQQWAVGKAFSRLDLVKKAVQDSQCIGGKGRCLEEESGVKLELANTSWTHAQWRLRRGDRCIGLDFDSDGYILGANYQECQPKERHYWFILAQSVGQYQLQSAFDPSLCLNAAKNSAGYFGVDRCEVSPAWGFYDLDFESITNLDSNTSSLHYSAIASRLPAYIYDPDVSGVYLRKYLADIQVRRKTWLPEVAKNPDDDDKPIIPPIRPELPVKPSLPDLNCFKLGLNGKPKLNNPDCGRITIDPEYPDYKPIGGSGPKPGIPRIDPTLVDRIKGLESIKDLRASTRTLEARRFNSTALDSLDRLPSTSILSRDLAKLSANEMASSRSELDRLMREFREYQAKESVNPNPANSLLDKLSTRSGYYETTVNRPLGTEWSFEKDDFAKDYVEVGRTGMASRRVAPVTLNDSLIREVVGSSKNEFEKTAGIYLVYDPDVARKIDAYINTRIRLAKKYKDWKETERYCVSIKENGSMLDFVTRYDYQGLNLTQVSYPSGDMIRYRYQGHELSLIQHVKDDRVKRLWERLESSDPMTKREKRSDRYIVERVFSHGHKNLDSVRINDINGTTLKEYQFGYNDQNLLAERYALHSDLKSMYVYNNFGQLTGFSLQHKGKELFGDEYNYDSLGNITYKKSLGSYAYDEKSAFKLTGISQGDKLHELVYDQVGRITKMGDHEIRYGLNGQMSELKRLLYRKHWVYNADAAIRRIDEYEGDLKVSSNYVLSDGFSFKRDIYGDRRYVISIGKDMRIQGDLGGLDFIEHQIQDQIGTSLISFLDDEGDLSQTRDTLIDPWGAPLAPKLSASDEILEASAAETEIAMSTVSYGTHELISGFEIIHMQGRVYSPALGRFLEPDPKIGRLDHIQSFNRYAYALNNPLLFNDPSGYSLVKKWGKEVERTIRRSAPVRIGLAIAVSIVNPAAAPYALSWAAGYEFMQNDEGKRATKRLVRGLDNAHPYTKNILGAGLCVLDTNVCAAYWTAINHGYSGDPFGSFQQGMKIYTMDYVMGDLADDYASYLKDAHQLSDTAISAARIAAQASISAINAYRSGGRWEFAIYSGLLSTAANGLIESYGASTNAGIWQKTLLRGLTGGLIDTAYGGSRFGQGAFWRGFLSSATASFVGHLKTLYIQQKQFEAFRKDLRDLMKENQRLRELLLASNGDDLSIMSAIVAMNEFSREFKAGFIEGVKEYVLGTYGEITGAIKMVLELIDSDINFSFSGVLENINNVMDYLANNHSELANKLVSMVLEQLRKLPKLLSNPKALGNLAAKISSEIVVTLAGAKLLQTILKATGGLKLITGLGRQVIRSVAKGQELLRVLVERIPGVSRIVGKIDNLSAKDLEVLDALDKMDDGLASGLVNSTSKVDEIRDLAVSLDKLGINDQSAFDKVLETINGFGKASQAEIARVMKAASGLGVKGQEALSDLYKSIAKLSPCRLASLDGGGFRRVMYAVVSSLFVSTAYADTGCGPGGVTGYVARTLHSAKVFTDKLSPGKIKTYLSKVDEVPRTTLVKDMESIGLKIKGNDNTRPFLEFVDHKGRLRAKIHPPDKATKNHHLHIYDKDGNPMTSALEVITGKKGYKSPDAHIPIQEP